MPDEECEHRANLVRFNEAQQRRECVCTDCGRVHVWMTREMLDGFPGAESLWRDRLTTALRLVYLARARRATAHRGQPTG